MFTKVGVSSFLWRFGLNDNCDELIRERCGFFRDTGHCTYPRLFHISLRNQNLLLGFVYIKVSRSMWTRIHRLAFQKIWALANRQMDDLNWYSSFCFACAALNWLLSKLKNPHWNVLKVSSIICISILDIRDLIVFRIKSPRQTVLLKTGVHQLHITNRRCWMDNATMRIPLLRTHLAKYAHSRQQTPLCVCLDSSNGSKPSMR